MITVATIALLASGAFAQSIHGWGTSGGTGPRGGIGDENNPVLEPAAYITDTLISVPEANTTRHLAQGDPPVRIAAGSSPCNPRNVVVDSTANGARQEMLGFGFSMTDSSVSVFNQLEDNVLNQLMEDLFGQTGNNMGLMRHSIGSSDLSGNQYSYADNGPDFNSGEPDPDLANFDLGPDGVAMAKILAKMGEYKSDVTLFGSPWSYPGWMKNNHLFIAPNQQHGYNLLNNSFNPKYYQSARRYFTKYIDAFKQHGVTVNGLTLMNEPLNYQGGYPCMYLDAVDAAGILSSGLGDDLATRNVKVIAYDHNTDQPGYPYRVSQAAHIDGVAWHCYAYPANYSVLDDFSVMVPGKIQLMSECTSSKPMPGDYSSWIAQHFLDPVRHGASGGTFWVLATDPHYGPHSPSGGCDTCQGALWVNSSTTYTRTHDYYMMGQFSRFVRRGSVNHYIREGYSGDGRTPDDQFYVMAVQNPDKSWAVVFMNNLKDDQNVALSFTDQPGESWNGDIPKSSVVTWLIPSRERLYQNGPGPGRSPFPLGNGTSSGPLGFGTAPSCPTTALPATNASSSSSNTNAPPPLAVLNAN